MNDFIQVGWNTNFTMVPNELWEIDFLEQEHIVVFLYLAKLGASSKGAFPSYPDLANKCKIRDKKGDISKRKARNIIDKLISFGLLKKGNRKNRTTGKFTSNIYFLAHPSKLLNPIETSDSEDYEIDFGTPCAKPSSQDTSNTTKTKESKLGTGCANAKALETIEVESVDVSENVTYKDLSIKTNLLRSSSEDLDPEKKNSYDFLNNYSLKNRTIATIIKNFKNITPESFKELHTKLKSDPRVRSIDAAIITSLSGNWEDFKESVINTTSTPKGIRGDSTTIEKIETDKIIDQKHMLETKKEADKFMEIFNKMSTVEQDEVIEKARLSYLESTGSQSFNSIHNNIFNHTKNTFIISILKKRNIGGTLL